MSRSRAPSVTVAVVVKDRREAMARCLDAIDAQDHPDFEILVVDNGSTDGTYQALLERRGRSSRTFTVEQQPGSLGHVRNHALRTARTDLIAFTDSDCVAEPGWLRAGLAQFNDRIGVVQGRTVPARPATSFEATIDISAFSHRYETCNIFYRRAALLDAGGFGEEMPQIGEDMVGGWRLRRAGWEWAWADDAVVAHDVTYPPIRWWVRRGFRYECWPQLVRDFPEARDELLYRGFLLNKRHIFVFAAAAGIVAAVALRNPIPVIATAPLLWRWRPLPKRGRTVRNSVCALAFDAASVAGVVTGSVKHRTLVL